MLCFKMMYTKMATSLNLSVYYPILFNLHSVYIMLWIDFHCHWNSEILFFMNVFFKFSQILPQFMSLSYSFSHFIFALGNWKSSVYILVSNLLV